MSENPNDIEVASANQALAEPAHVVVVHEDANGDEAGADFTRAYVNGVEVAAFEDASGFADVADALQFGARVGDNGFVGLIDDVQVYGRALTESEVMELFGNPGSAIGIDGDPVVMPPVGEDLSALSGVGKSASGFGLTLPDGLTGDIEYSIDLIDWQSGAYEDSDAGRLTAPSGYYRAVRP